MCGGNGSLIDLSIMVQYMTQATALANPMKHNSIGSLEIPIGIQGGPITLSTTRHVALDVSESGHQRPSTRFQ